MEKGIYCVRIRTNDPVYDLRFPRWLKEGANPLFDSEDGITTDDVDFAQEFSTELDAWTAGTLYQESIRRAKEKGIDLGRLNDTFTTENLLSESIRHFVWVKAQRE